MRLLFHKFFYALLRFFVVPYFALFGNYKRQFYRPKSKNYIVLTNHNTDWDFFLVGACLPHQMYFVASEHILSGFTGRLIKFLVDPIPRPKGASAEQTVAMITERLKQGHNVCMFVEGNRSFSGETGWISPANGPLVKNSGAGLITVATHGGYFVDPRWSDRPRKGPAWGEVVREYTPEELASMSEEEITAAIRKDLYVDAYADQEVKPGRYRGKDLAQHLETALFVCPQCGSMSGLRSAGDRFFCADCGMELEFTEYGYFRSPYQDMPGPRFTTVRDWDRWQQTVLHDYFDANREDPGKLLFSDSGLTLKRINEDHSRSIISTGTARMYPDRLVFEGDEERSCFFLSDISRMSVTLRDRLMFTSSGGYFEIVSDHPYPGRKYMLAWRYLCGKTYR
ncbi:MAG: 1-acyl-sn-glycerol-3-phosphate acyltransferase [Firmicutes bacterium]|nr:1-acyl-sn-glycerol-3-phosphate acyltransferase [Bacillota bacterium]